MLVEAVLTGKGVTRLHIKIRFTSNLGQLYLNSFIRFRKRKQPVILTHK